MEGLHKPDSHALNASGLLGFGFKSRKKKKKKCSNRKVVANIFYHIAYLLILPSEFMIVFEDRGLCLLFASATVLGIWEILCKQMKLIPRTLLMEIASEW